MMDSLLEYYMIFFLICCFTLSRVMQSKASREAVVSFIVTFFYCVSTHEQECLRSESQWTNGMNVCVCVWPRCGFERRSLRRDLLVKIPIDTNFRLFSKFSSLK